MERHIFSKNGKFCGFKYDQNSFIIEQKILCPPENYKKLEKLLEIFNHISKDFVNFFYINKFLKYIEDENMDDINFLYTIYDENYEMKCSEKYYNSCFKCFLEYGHIISYDKNFNLLFFNYYDLKYNIHTIYFKNDRLRIQPELKLEDIELITHTIRKMKNLNLYFEEDYGNNYKLKILEYFEQIVNHLVLNKSIIYTFNYLNEILHKENFKLLKMKLLNKNLNI